MTPEEFAYKAGFPPDWEEKHLQQYIAKVMKSRGIDVETEVTLGKGGRADIITQELVGGEIIEVKKFLTRDSIYQAFGQATCYARYAPGKSIVIMGFAPNSMSSYDSAKTTAWYVEQSGAKVVFVNTVPEWCPGDKEIGLLLKLWYALCGKFSLSTGLNFSWSKYLTMENGAIALVLIALISYYLSSGMNTTQVDNKPQIHLHQKAQQTHSHKKHRR